jgi:hypothetical protein
VYIYIFFLSPILFFYLLFDLLPVATPVILAVGHSPQQAKVSLSVCVYALENKRDRETVSRVSGQ